MSTIFLAELILTLFLCGIETCKNSFYRVHYILIKAVLEFRVVWLAKPESTKQQYKVFLNTAITKFNIKGRLLDAKNHTLIPLEYLKFEPPKKVRYTWLLGYMYWLMNKRIVQDVQPFSATITYTDKR